MAPLTELLADIFCFGLQAMHDVLASSASLGLCREAQGEDTVYDLEAFTTTCAHTDTVSS